jgi:hypothetical protein
MMLRGYSTGNKHPIAVDNGGQLLVVAGRNDALGYQRLTGMSSSTALSVPAGARFAIVQVEGEDMRWRDDGVDPTIAIGMLLKNGAAMIYDGPLAALRFIQVSSGALINIAYYG